MEENANGSSPSGINVFLIAENRLLRETLSRLLQKRAGIDAVGVSWGAGSAVRGVAQGEAACPPKLCMTLIQYLSREYRQRAKVSSEQGSAKRMLTYRQLELMDLVARGMSNKEIAANLHLSEFTVKNQMRRIMKQVDADDRHEAVHLIRASGFLPNA